MGPLPRVRSSSRASGSGSAGRRKRQSNGRSGARIQRARSRCSRFARCSRPKTSAPRSLPSCANRNSGSVRRCPQMRRARSVGHRVSLRPPSNALTLNAQRLTLYATMTFLSDLRRAFRSLYKARGFAGAVILTLALGIGANTAMFTLLRGTLLRPLPNRQGERLVYLRQSAKGAGQDNVGFSVPEIIDYRSATKTLASVAEYSSMTFTWLA